MMMRRHHVNNGGILGRDPVEVEAEFNAQQSRAKLTEQLQVQRELKERARFNQRLTNIRNGAA
jgi:hypothetical protein